MNTDKGVNHIKTNSKDNLNEKINTKMNGSNDKFGDKKYFDTIKR